MTQGPDIYDPDPARRLYHLGLQSKDTFFRTSDMQNLNDAIVGLSEAVNLRPPAYNDPGPIFEDARWTWLMNLGAAFRTRYNRLGHMEDLDEVIVQLEEAVSLCPITDPRRSHLLNNLGRSLRSLFDRTGNVSALQRAVELFRDALDLRPVQHPDRVTSLGDLANCLSARYKHEGRREDLDEAIMRHREALEIRPVDHPDLWMVQSNLGNALAARFEMSGDFREIDDAVKLQREAVQRCPESHRDRANPVTNLASTLHTRFRFRQDELHARDLDEAVALNYEALRLRPISHPARSTSLDNLANTLSSRYKYSGNIQDLDEAIRDHREALVLRPEGPARAMTLNNLALSLGHRYNEAHNEDDLAESIQMHRDALALRPVGHPDHWMSLSHLGSALEKYTDLGEPSFLHEALGCHRQALKSCPDSFVARRMVLSNLGGTSLSRYQQYHDDEDLDESVRRNEEALALYHRNHPWRAMALYNVAMAREVRFDNRHDNHDLREVIRRNEESQELLPPDHPLRCNVLLSLARAYLCEEPCTHDSFSLFAKAAAQKTSTAQDRFQAAVYWATAARRLNHSSTIPAYTLALSLLDRCLTSLPTAEMQHKLLAQMPPALASDACSAAIELGQLDTAIELLEQGRCLLWTRMTRYQHPLDSLRKVAPDLACEFESSSWELETLATSSAKVLRGNQAEDSDSTNQTLFEHQIELLHRASDRWDKVVDQIRQVEGYVNFLKAVPFSELQKAVVDGPIIIVNISKYRSDAIIMCNARPPVSIALPDATPEILKGLASKFTECLDHLHSDADQANQERTTGWSLASLWPVSIWTVPTAQADTTTHRHREKIREILRRLWTCLVKPVAEKLDEIEYRSQLSRVWWYPTGALCRLPLHAAGPHLRGSQGQNFCDLYVSSYITTLARMLDSRSRLGAKTLENVASLPNMLVIGVPGVPNEKSFLENVETEISIIQELASPKSLSSPVQVLMGQDATPEAVQTYLPKHSWVHLVCHGHQRPSPFESSFQLYDERHISLIDLMRSHIPGAELAYLSACNTATGDFDKTPGEFIHLAAAMQFCGFRSVVGTLWPMRDKDGPPTTRAFYAHMFRRDGVTDFTDSARALHNAVKSLRDRNVPIDCWINFVHFGI